MRIMTLSEMVTELRIEARISTNIAHGVHLLEQQKATLRRIQEELYDAYDWPHLKINEIVDVLAGERYKTYPTTMTFDGIQEVTAKQRDNRWLPVEYGISTHEYNFKNSDLDFRDFPIRRWQNYFSPAAETVSQTMFEVWPIPSVDTQLRFRGKRALFPFTDDGHSCSLDGPLIVLHAAAEILAGQKAEDAQLKLQKAQARMDLLKKRQTAMDNHQTNLSQPQRGPRLRYGLDYVE